METEMNETGYVQVHQVVEVVKHYALTPELWDHTAVFLGPTAIGKTEAVREGLQRALAVMNERRQAMGAAPRQLILHELHVSQMGPVDALGVPRERSGRTYWAPPEIWPLTQALPGYDDQVNAFLDHYRRTGETAWELMPEQWFVHFHDEVTNPSTPQVPHQLFPVWCGTAHGRVIGGHPLVRDFMVVLAGNRVEDGTNSINLAASAVTRMCILQVTASLDGWLQNYAFQEVVVAGQKTTKIHPSIIAFLTKNPQYFAPQDLDKRSPMDPFPTPRAWKFVSDLFFTRGSLSDDLFWSNVAGRIGAPTTEELRAFIAFAADLPEVDAILAGGPTDRWPDPTKRPDLVLIATTQMVAKLNATNAKRFMEIISDEALVPAEFSARAIKLVRNAGKLQSLVHSWDTEGFRAWTKKYHQMIF